MAIKAMFAVWGALANGDPNEARAADEGESCNNCLTLARHWSPSTTTILVILQSVLRNILRQLSTTTAGFRTTPARKARRLTSRRRAARLRGLGSTVIPPAKVNRSRR